MIVEAAIMRDRIKQKMREKNKKTDNKKKQKNLL